MKKNAIRKAINVRIIIYNNESTGATVATSNSMKRERKNAHA